MNPRQTIQAIPSAPTQVDAVLQAVQSGVRYLLHQRVDRAEALEQVELLDRLIQSLPLAADDFAVVKCRLRSACRYLKSDEVGAARYELRLLLGRMGAVFS